MKATNPTQKIENDRDLFDEVVDNDTHSGGHAYDVKEVNGRVHLTVYGNDFLSTQIRELMRLPGYELNSIGETLPSNEYAVKVLLTAEVDA